MTSIREYDVKLGSLKNTRKMTKTMKMVSVGKLQKALVAQRDAHTYADRLNEMIARLATSLDRAAHPLLTPHSEPRRALILLFTSDKGMCGGFNNNLIRYLNQWIKEHRERYDQVDLSFCGRRGHVFFRSRFTVNTLYEGVTLKPSFLDAVRIGKELIQSFTSEAYDEVFIAYNQFINALSQKPVIEKLLPIAPREEPPIFDLFPLDYVFEPDREQVLAELLPRTLYFKLYYTLLENAAGEHGARMTAMDNATRNADDMVDRYTLLRNRARQAAITTELIEIISGAETL